MGLHLPPSVLVHWDTYSRPTEGCSQALAVAQLRSVVGGVASWTCSVDVFLVSFPRCSSVRSPRRRSFPSSNLPPSLPPPSPPIVPHHPSHLSVHLLSSPWLQHSQCFMLSWRPGSRLKPDITRWRRPGPSEEHAALRKRVFVRLLMIQRKRLHGSHMHETPPQTNWSEG